VIYCLAVRTLTLAIACGVLFSLGLLEADDLPASKATAQTPAEQRIKKKLDSIIIDRFNFEQIDLTLMLRYLSKRSRELDPDHVGVRFVLEGPNPKWPPRPGSYDGLADLPLSEILRYVCSLTDTAYRIEEDHVVVFSRKK